jgi:hypothetical protein
VIACLERSNGQFLFLDPTDKQSAWYSSSDWLIGQKVHIIRRDSSRIDTIQPSPWYQNKIFTHSRIVFNTSENHWCLDGEISLKGDLAENLLESIKNRENIDQAKLLKDWLENNLAIISLKADMNRVSEDSLVISYFADASRCIVLSPVKQGIVFSMPALCMPHYELCDLSYEGDRYLWRIEQIDTWTLPENFSTNGFEQLQSTFGKGEWSVTGNTITRSYRCDFTRITVAQRDSLQMFFNERNRFANGVVWMQKL